ncbi:PKD domain-containing protein [Marinilabilia sp.]|uniref:PKD domain-containing protein n=1 Tax=Marinilabilia sp. TaxID=2021252 RepID=UPI0025B7DC23|nr:PKD domain-containing protein [Marinilabilia sp.]
MTPMKTISVLIALTALAISGRAPAQDIVIQPVKINTPGNSEIAPLLEDSVLYFISNRRTNLLVTYLNQDDELLYHVFTAPLQADGTLGKTTLFAPPDQPRYNAGSLTFSANGSQMIATHNKSNKTTTRKTRDQSNPLSLYAAEKKDKGWHGYEQLQLNIPLGSSIGHPSLSEDGRFLFFVSDMETGEGATDIYVSEKNGGKWGTPRNIGSHINTSGRELFPFIHPSGKLYFSSDAHNESGGLNIYYIDWKDTKANPVELPIPINSTSNDFSCFISDDEKWGYFASDRNGDDDIFRFSMPQVGCSDPQEIVEDNYCFTFFENGPFKSDTLPYIYRWDFGDGQNAIGLEVDHCFPGPGKYHINLNVVDTLLNEDLFSVASYDLNLERTSQIWFEAPDTIQTYQPIHLKAHPRELEGLSSEPVYWWSFGDGETRIGKNIDYQYKKAGNYQIICSTTLTDGRIICYYRNITIFDSQED